MSEIKLLLKNKTDLDLIFKYNGVKYEISARRDEQLHVEAGHMVSVYAPIGTKVKKREVESDLFIYPIEKDTALDCEIVSWQLQLRIGNWTY